MRWVVLREGQAGAFEPGLVEVAGCLAALDYCVVGVVLQFVCFDYFIIILSSAEIKLG